MTPAAPARTLDAEAFDRFLRSEKQRVDEAMDRISSAVDSWAPPHLAPAVRYALSTSGKRLRPILCVAGYRATGGEGDGADGIYRLACALEVVHTYSLVHDDLPCMDDDDLRRGRPTVHRVHGTPKAIVSGAALVSLAVKLLLEAAAGMGLSSGTIAGLVREICSAAGAAGMVGGQYLDLAAEQVEMDADGLEAIHRGKTGALLIASLRVGAIAAGAPPASLDAVTRYGSALGLAFQIADDILDVTGDTGALGKTAGRDAVLRKSSYPALHGLEGARRLARATSEEAKSAIRDLCSPELVALADYVVDRRN
jgi:geranylgeranyl diphosphate synthase, type II